MTNGTESYKRSYSLADIARKLNRPRTTVQAWRDQFKPYLPTVSGTKGRTLRYEESALSIFELIARMKDDNEPPEMIETALKQNVNFLIVEDDEDDDDTPFIATMFENVGKVTVALEEQKEFNKQLTERLDQQEAFNRQQEAFARSLLEKLEQQREFYEKKFEELKYDREFVSSLKNSMQQRKLESDERESETKKQLENIENHLTEIQQKQNENDAVKELAKKVADVQQMMKETATAQEEKKPKKRKGFWSWLSGE